MTKRRSKKNALFASIISMILCISMLIGSTMAWFTDTVSNTGNRIETGTLKVDLLMDKEDGAGYVSIADSKGDIFSEATGNGTKWEPGKTEIVFLQVKNMGDLALNYQIVLNVKNDASNKVDMADVLDYAILPNVTATDFRAANVQSWEEILKMEGIETGSVRAGETTAAPNGAIPEADGSDYFALAVHMDEKAGNEYQDQAIDIDVKVTARQMAHEYDSFSNQYDANAESGIIESNLNYSIITPDADLNPAEDFDVYQSHEVYPIAGNGGFAIVADFENGPGQIYVARTITNPDASASFNLGTPWDPMAIARVEDPDGNLVALYDFSDLTSGSEAVIIDIPEGKSGVWTIRVMNGQVGDIFEIGINDTDIWGVRGEKVLGSGTTSGDYYVYVQDYDNETAPYAFFASDSTANFGLYDLSGNPVGESNGSKVRDLYCQYGFETTNIEKGNVYKLSLPENFDSSIVIDGIPGLLCPTPAAAEALKGNWVENDGVLYQGVLQARAREQIVNLATNYNLEVTIDKPEELPEIEDAIAEAQLFGGYGVISSLGNNLDRQIIDPDSPFCGRVFGASEWDYTNKYPKDPDKWLKFQWGLYGGSSASEPMRGAVAAFAAAATTDLDLNYFYENEALITRTVMHLLYQISVGLDEGGLVRQSDLRSYTYLHNDSAFAYGLMFEAYEAIAPYLDYLDASTREVLREGMMLLCDKNGDYRGQGLTNQAAFGMSGRLAMYSVTGDERYHEAFKRQITAILDNKWSNYGVNKAGFFVEGGCDGSYSYMNYEEYYTIYLNYKNLADADPVLVEKMRDMVEKTLEFESLFAVQQPPESTGFSIGAMHYTSRSTSVALGRYAQPSFQLVKHEFPTAARRWYLMTAAQQNGYASYPSLINTDEEALKYINTYWDSYEYYYKGTKSSNSRNGSGQVMRTYEAFNSGTAEPSVLPFESEDGYLRENSDGIVALKHKGIYLLSFYAVQIDHLGEVVPKEAYMGGGPSIVASEGTGSVVVSRKHKQINEALTQGADIAASCIYGTDADGTFFVSGKEYATLTWLKDGESFVISGNDPATGRTISWQYDLTDTGVDVTASLTGADADGTYYMNLPIYTGENGKASTVTLNGNTFTFKMGETVMEYTWDESLTATLEKTNASANYRELRIELPQGTAAAKVSMRLVQ